MTFWIDQIPFDLADKIIKSIFLKQGRGKLSMNKLHILWTVRNKLNSYRWINIQLFLPTNYF